MKFLNIPSNYNFLKSLHSYIMENFKNNIDMSFINIFLPSRRSVNELKRIFLENSNKSVILPNIKAIGDIDYDEILTINYENIDKYLESTKISSNIKYKLLLIKKLREETNITVDQAINLSNELNNFLLEVEQQELDLKDIDNIVDDEYSIYWQKVIKFLKDFSTKWQNFLKESNFISKNKSSLINIKFYTDNFINNAPKYPIIFAGIFTDIKITLNLIKTLSKYDNTYYFMSGYINNCISEEIDSNYYYNNIIKFLNIENIENIEYENHRVIENIEAINLSMSNYSLTNSWYNIKNTKNVKKVENIKYIECENIYEEMDIITFYILNYINENKLKNIAIITTEEYSHLINLNLKRYNLPTNNSFGNKYTNNEFIKYFLLLIECYINNFKKDLFISLLKNSRTNFGYSTDKFKELIKKIENKIFIDSFDSGDIDFYIKKAKEDEEISNFFEKILEYFKYFDNKKNMKDFLILHLNLLKDISENLSEEDIKVIEYINKEIMEQIDIEYNITVEEYFKLIEYVFSTQSYNDSYSIYPSINIISQLESRLINYDLVILFNMNDGIFPKNIKTDAWMNKNMREKFGLPKREVEIGKSAHDFIRLLSQKEVLITRSKKIDNKITFESRFLKRLKTFLNCNDDKIKTDDKFHKIYKILNKKTYTNEYYKKRPEPNPDIKYRPRELSQTAIGILKKNPYDFYVKYILKLRESNIFKNVSISNKIGTLMHKLFEDYEKIDGIDIENIINEFFFNNELIIKFYNDTIKTGFENFLELRKESESKEVYTEEEHFTVICDNYKIKAKIDRIEKKEDNKYNVIDYKTGKSIPTKREIENGKELQLLISSFILFKKKYDIEKFGYWHINGKEKGSRYEYFSNELSDKIEKHLIEIIKYFEKEKYIATNRKSEYENLIRLEEWIEFTYNK